MGTFKNAMHILCVNNENNEVGTAYCHVILVKDDGHANGYSFCSSSEHGCFVRAECNPFDSGGNPFLQTENAVLEFHLQIKLFSYSERPDFK